MASLLSLNSSEQYKTDSALTVVTRESIDAYLAALTPSNARDLNSAIKQILPVINAQLDTTAQELKAAGGVLADTMNYAKGFKQDSEAVSFTNINNLLTKSGTASAGSTTSGAQQTFIDNNFELLKQYRFKQSLVLFYSKYSAHLQARRERLNNTLQTLAAVRDNLTIIWDAVQKKL